MKVEVPTMISVERLNQMFMAFSQGDNEQMKVIQTQLNTLCIQPGFLSTLLELPTTENVNQYSAKMAVVYTQTYAQKIIKTKDQAKINVMAEQLLQYLTSNVKLELKQHIVTTLEFIIGQDNRHIMVNAFIPNYIQLLKRSINQPDSNINFQYIGLYAQILININTLHSEQIVHFIQQTLPNFAALNLRLMQYSTAQENGFILQKSFQLSLIYSSVIKAYLKKFLLVNSVVASLLFDERIVSLILMGLTFTLPNNQMNSPIIYVGQENPTIILYHKIKANFINIISQSLRVLIFSDKLNISLADNNIIKAVPGFIDCFVQSVKGYLDKVQYFKIKSQSVVKIIEEVYNFLMPCLRSNLFYNCFLSLKQEIIECLYRTLALSPADYDNYYNHPEEFINSINHIFDMNVVATLKPKKKGIQEQSESEDEDIQMYETMKTIAACLLDSLCNYIDGALTEIFYFSGNILEDFLNTEYSKNLLLIVLCILRNLAKERTDLHAKLSAILFKLLKDLQIPKKSVKEPENVQFSLTLMTLVRYFPFIAEINDSFVEKTFNLTELILECPNVEDVAKLISYDLIICLLHFEEASIYCLRFLCVFNRLLQSPKQVEHKFLECLCFFFKLNDFQFKSNPVVVLDTVTKLVELLKLQAQGSHEKIKIAAAWNVIEEIASSSMIITNTSQQKSQILQKIQEIILPLFGLANSNLHYEERFFKIFSISIKKNKSITQCDYQVMERLPTIIYNNQHLLHDAFEFIQLFIFYGAESLMSSPELIKNMILLGNNAMNEEKVNAKITEANSCEGVLILQSLMIACGRCFSDEMWMVITNNNIKRLHNPPIHYDFLRSNIITNLSLILMYAHKFFNPEDCDTMLGQMLKEISCFTSRKSSKIFIITLCQFINLIQTEFIQKRFVQILDSLITLLEVASLKKDQLFNNAELDPQEIQFTKASKLVINHINSINELQYFRNHIQKLKQHYPQVLEASYNELPQKKREYFRQVLSSVKVGEETRKILKIKK